MIIGIELGASARDTFGGIEFARMQADPGSELCGFGEVCRANWRAASDIYVWLDDQGEVEWFPVVRGRTSIPQVAR